MCAERFFSLFIAIVLGINMGVAGSGDFKSAFLISLLLIILLLAVAIVKGGVIRRAIKSFLPQCKEE